MFCLRWSIKSLTLSSRSCCVKSIQQRKAFLITLCFLKVLAMISFLSSFWICGSMSCERSKSLGEICAENEIPDKLSSINEECSLLIELRCIVLLCFIFGSNWITFGWGRTFFLELFFDISIFCWEFWGDVSECPVRRAFSREGKYFLLFCSLIFS